MPAHERDRIAVPAVVKLLAALLGTILVSAALSAWLLQVLGKATGDNAAFAHADPLPAFAAPRLQPKPQLDIDDYRAAKRAQLETYRWIDREQGVVAIPIERAMELLARRSAAMNGPAR